jgi:hypothetical protein
MNLARPAGGTFSGSAITARCSACWRAVTSASFALILRTHDRECVRSTQGPVRCGRRCSLRWARSSRTTNKMVVSFRRTFTISHSSHARCESFRWAASPPTHTITQMSMQMSQHPFAGATARSNFTSNARISLSSPRPKASPQPNNAALAVALRLVPRHSSRKHMLTCLAPPSPSHIPRFSRAAAAATGRAGP